jgi:hypothetical protein
VNGTDFYDTIAIKWINDRAAEGTIKKSGKVLSKPRRVISEHDK